jgi:hypothetical protein
MILENRGPLITTQGGNECLGYLMDFKHKGVFDAKYGKVDVTPEQAETHNRLLDTALLVGLDANCRVGQGGSFYLRRNPQGPPVVVTFLGTIVSNDVSIRHGKINRVTGRRRETLEFTRLGKLYRGIIQKDSDLFNFRRIG